MLENFSLFALALVCFISASIYPLASEAFVVAFVINGFDKNLVFLIASIFNTLGALSTYILGLFASKFILEKYFSKSIYKIRHSKINFKKYGLFFAFFSFLPIIGDLFVLALALNKYPFLKASIFIFLGKAFRYALLIFLI
ncbi:DedA family protein [uncultured Campylobacter sp.]|uniref:YqaA family protein n=1 Tax=uncultured Campylobacter sp. TaxID=218934 RepID=UPI00260B21FC|nr:DedA family protein [uncultured Campylobacter sp.]